MKVREKKLAKLELQAQEKAAIIARRNNRLAPTMRWFRRVSMAITATIVLLYLGWFINLHLAGLVSRINQGHHL